MALTYTIMYNRSTNHLAGVAIRSAGDGSRPEDAFNACGALTRGRFATGKSFTDLTEAFEALESSTRATGRKTCKACLKAIHAQQVQERDAETLVSSVIDAQPTDADRADYRSLMDASKVYPAGSGDRAELQAVAADMLVSCYIGGSEMGPEEVHGLRRDGSCRCGIRKARYVHGQTVTLTTRWGTEQAEVDENHGDGTVTVRSFNSEEFHTVKEHLLFH
jgi:hypothetical protein